MISRYSYNDLVWVDLESPTVDEVRQIMEEFSIPPLVGNELVSHSERPKVDLYDQFVYLILHFPTITHKHGASTEQEIDFIIAKNFIITTHYEVIDPLHEFSKLFEVNTILNKQTIGLHGGFVFFYIIREIYQYLGRELDHIERALAHAQSEIFSGKETSMVAELSHINRDLLMFKQAIRYHHHVLESFELAGKRLFGEEFSYYLRSITGEYLKVASLLDSHKDTLNELRETNATLLTTKTNDIMQTLTVMAFSTLPLSLVAGIFSMNTQHMPIIDFWVVIGVMVALAIAMALFFKRRQWF
ncbi:MAG: magnesium transporter CorA family protein [Minisyncoccota bacterium]